MSTRLGCLVQHGRLCLLHLYMYQSVNLFANKYSNMPSKEITKHQVLAGLKGRIICTNRSPLVASTSTNIVGGKCVSLI